VKKDAIVVMNRPLFPYQQAQQPSVVSGVRWASLTVALLIVTLILIGICGAAIYFGVDSEHRQNAEERVIDALALKEQDDVNALAASDAELLAELLTINTTLTNDITFLAAALNLTSYNGQTFVQQIQAQIAADVSTLDAAIALRMISINNVDGDNSTHNINLLAGPGITVTPHAGAHTLTLGNAGVLTLSGVSPPVLGGNIEVLGVGMLSVYGNSNASSLTVDASLLVTAVSNLQTQESAQQVEINALQVNVTNLETQISNIQLAEYMLQQAVNGSVITINITLTDLIAGLAQAQAEIAALQAEVANQTQGVSIPTGAMFPWTGAPNTVPAGYLLCNGTEYLSSAYAALYAVIGTLYCEGNCSVGSFRVPAMGGCVPVGLGGGGVFQAAVGTEVGSEQQTLSTPNLPSHSHTATTVAAGSHNHVAQTAAVGPIWTLIENGDTGSQTHLHEGGSPGFDLCNNPSHSLALPNCGGNGNYPSSDPYFTSIEASGAPFSLPFGDHAHTTNTEGSHTHTVNVANTGSGTAFNVVQPSLVVQYIIKT